MKKKTNDQKQSVIKIFGAVSIALLLGINTLFSQSLTEKFGGVKTNFIITSTLKELPVLEQVIIQRGHYRSDYGSHNDAAYGFGYGMQTYRLEFLTSKRLTLINMNKKLFQNKYYTISLCDEMDKTLLITDLNYDDVIVSTNEDDLITYSVNLNKIPLILLDKTTKINLDIINP